ncbi:MAG: hypothetical protein HY801_14325 [Candidatus Lindowbacteria bacterium]|nr:hypothetical protein [Candidatus Lindowbacteria bacterium]
MSSLAPYWISKLLLARNTIRSVRKESKLKLVVVTSWLTVFLSVGCWFFFKAFEFLYTFPVGDLLAIRVLALFFLTLFAMLVFSNILVAFSTMYKSSETDFLFSLPMEDQEIFISRFFETLAYSSWAFIFLGIPLMVSYGVVFRVRWYFYPALPLFFLPFVTIAGILGALIMMVMMRVFPKMNFKVVAAMIGLLGLGFAAFLYRSFSVSHISQLEIIDQILSALKTTQSPYFPSHRVNEGISRILVSQRMGRSTGFQPDPFLSGGKGSAEQDRGALEAVALADTRARHERLTSILARSDTVDTVHALLRFADCVREQSL